MTRLTQMDVNIDEAGSDDEPFGVECFVGLAAQLAGGSDFNHPTIFEQEIILALKTLSGIDEKTVADCESSFVIHAKTKKLFRRRFAQMNADLFSFVFKREAFYLGPRAEVQQKSYFNFCGSQIVK